LIGRQQLPVSSTITVRSLVRAVGPALAGGAGARAALETELRHAFNADRALLVDSGTSALALALRAAAKPGGVVALPAYACVDIGAAAIFAQLRVRLYDVYPVSLSADLESVSRVLEQGADVIVASHLYGYATDVPGIAALAAAHGAAVVEDAAQGAWGSLGGTRLGAFGPLSVLSFGRGKGMTGAGGGALLAIGGAHVSALDAMRPKLASARSDVMTLTMAKAQWLLGRPSLYGLPSSIPALHLGETIYHHAHDAREITGVSASLVREALARADADLRLRTEHARELELAARGAAGVQVTRAIAGATPGYLRLPVRLTRARGANRERSRLGIVRGYPETLAELPELAPLVIGDETLAGARELASNLITLPTHSLLTKKDLRMLSEWVVD
jgi:dTDP-4-amino-4,6-dideoxygalactose transaminase